MKKIYRLLFSRYAVSALMIALEILLLVFLFVKATEVSYIFFIIATLLDFIIIVAIVNSDANPEYKTSWISVSLLLPFFGALLYVIFNKRRMTRREIRLGREILARLGTDDRGSEELNALGKLDSRAAGQAMAIMKNDPVASLYTSTEAEYFATGEDMHEAMLRDISYAARYVFLEYFIIKDGEMWRSIRSLLIECAARGVEVRLLYDDIGCMHGISADDVKSMRAHGIKCAAFARVNPSLSTVHNNRDHRKICVVDGRVAYTGGINIADEYINAEVRFGHWKDGGVRIFGEAVRGFVKLYLQNWSFNSGKCEEFSPFLAHESFTNEGNGYFLPFGSGPAPIYPRPVGKHVFLNLINQAERYVYITTPYLIIDYDLTEALRGASLRGVDVRIITPGIPDKKAVKIMTKSAYPRLIEAGVAIYEYAPGFIHEKLFVSDDLYTVIGSINFDYRSLAHHFECAVWCYSSSLAMTARSAFIAAEERSTRMEESSSRLSALEWILKIFIRFIAPLL